MRKILVIPDIHGRSFWKESVEKYTDEVDKVMFLGDIVDPYPDENITRKEAINILKETIEYKKKYKDKVILLYGNHDASYALPNFIRCTRFDSSNAYKIKEIYYSHKDLFKLAHEEVLNGKKYLFTHAGLMNSWIKRHEKLIGEQTVESLNGLAKLRIGSAILSEMSRYRSWTGEESGSILWSDIQEKISDDSTIDNIITEDDAIVEGYDYQIFGHTFLERPIITDKWACLDCQKAFILDEEGTLKEV